MKLGIKIFHWRDEIETISKTNALVEQPQLVEEVEVVGVEMMN